MGSSEGQNPAQDDAKAPWAPRRDLLRAIIFLLIAFVSLLFVYDRTAAPGAWWGDGLEFACAAKTLGIPHPTGYPLYMMLGHAAMALLSHIDPGRALTLLSSFFCALASTLMGWVVYARASRAAAQHGENSAGPLVSAFGVVFIFGFTRTLWEHATFAEVYPLTLLFVVGIVALVIGESKTPVSLGRTAALGALWGLGLLNHYSLAAIGPLALFALIRWSRGSTKRMVTHFVVFTLVSSSCLLGYLYLPLRAATNPPINWGDPSNWERFVWVLKGGSYVGSRFLGGRPVTAAIASGSAYWLQWWGIQILPEQLYARGGLGDFISGVAGLIIAAGGFAGCLSLARRELSLGLGLAASILVTLLFSILYVIPDRDAYLMPALPAAVLGWSELIRVMLARTSAASESAARFRPRAILPLALGAALGLIHAPWVNKSWDDGPDLWPRAVFAAVPQDAIVLTRQGEDSEIYSLWYEQIVRGERPDVTLFCIGGLFSGWYQKYFEAAGRPHISLFIQGRNGPVVDEAIFNAAMAGGVIAPNYQHRRIFVTAPSLDPAQTDPLFREMAPTPVAELLPEAYYKKTAYEFNPPGRLLLELHPTEALMKKYRESFEKIFGAPPPSAE